MEENRVCTVKCSALVAVAVDQRLKFMVINCASTCTGLSDYKCVSLVLCLLQKLDQQSVHGVTALQEEFRKELVRSFREKSDVVEQIAKTVQILLSFTFITVFTS